ncbi:hypothetical protein CXB40_21005 [Pseudomonas syringae pv. avii]|nr:hypothetical protein [Pseudomonas syringae]POQ05187.1 hypothetical protein CXB40_21005 [Pseudomonas syringae pv. avii]PYD05840.1 hypothetical protein DND90_20860 [Pseudomonas syringae pv. maculicola]TES64210.1 hypothetical protein E2N90_24380 [Pseudomonas syringae pv. tomato]MCF5242531.1 hypothetical protein [Pseudomonas syringae]
MYERQAKTFVIRVVGHSMFVAVQGSESARRRA